MILRTLIDRDTLGGRLDDPTVAVIDCRFSLDDESWGERAYVASHIPGAAYAHLKRDLSSAPTGRNGRHPLPDPGVLRQTLGRLGIDRTVQVVAYDQDSGMWASRLWWLLRWMGHDAVAVLDGGFARWQAAGRLTGSGVEAHKARAFDGAPGAGMTVTADEVAKLGAGGRLIDARAPERYRGDVEPIDRVPGHIPGAVNRFFQDNLRQDGTFQSPAELRAALSGALAGQPPDCAICYCGSGVSACHNLLALEHAGLTGVKLYPGSWSEWSSDPARPIERTTDKPRSTGAS